MSQETPTLLEEAANPATDPERLRQLTGHGQRVREAVALNPNAPTFVLTWLAKWHWELVLRNPVLPLLLLENPGFPVEFPVAALREILRMENPPREFLAPLQRHSNQEIREAARLHRANGAGDGHAPDVPLTGGAALEELLTMGLAPTWMVQAALECSSGTLRRRALRALSVSGEVELWERVAWMREAGADNRLQYLGKGKQHMKPERLAALARGGPFARRLAARHSNTPPEMLAELAEFHQEDLVRRYAAGNRSTPGPTLISLATTGDAAIRQAVARNKGCPSGFLDQLAGDPLLAVRRIVAANRASPSGTLARLASDLDEKLRRALARNSSTDETTVRLLAQDKEDRVRREIARRRRCPPDVLLTLMADKEFLVAHYAAENRSTPGDPEIRINRVHSRDFREEQSPETLLTPLSAAPNPEEVECARMMRLLEAKPVSLEVLREAVAHPDEKVRQRASHKEGMTPDLLALLMHDENSHIRSAVARNPLLPRELRLKLCEDETSYVRAEALEAGDMPPEVFERMRCSEDDWLRLRVAGSKNTPDAVRIRLAREEQSESVLEHLFSNPYLGTFENRVPDEAMLIVFERFPSFAKKIAAYDHVTPPVVEALLPQLGRHDREWLFHHQSFARKWQHKEVMPWPTETLLKICELPDEEHRWWWEHRLRLLLVDYWAVTPEALEAIARIEIAEAATRASWRKRQTCADGILARIARHLLAPPSLLTEMTLHPAHRVRVAALENPCTPPEAKAARRDAALRDAAVSTGVTVRLCALSSPDTAQETLRKAAFQGRWMERLAVARNAGAPRQILAYLAEDANVAVADAARETLAARDATPPT